MNIVVWIITAVLALAFLAAIGLIPPAVTGIAPVLVPLAALGLVALLIGAAITHVRRSENQMVMIPAVVHPPHQQRQRHETSPRRVALALDRVWLGGQTPTREEVCHVKHQHLHLHQRTGP